jgi:opacity protein-like surface antigen
MRRSKARSIQRTLLGGMLALLVSAGMAEAQDSKSSDAWTFQFTPYLWLASLSGTVGASENLPTVSVDASFGDIFSHLDAGFMGIGEARHGRLIVLGDVSYVSLSAGAGSAGPLLGSAEVHAKSFTSTIEGGYRIVNSPSLSVDGLAGLRVFSVSNEIDFSGGLLAPMSPESSDSWVDPVIGVRVIAPLGAGFLANAYGDVGGFGISSDLTWQIYGGLGYQINSSITAYAGYRYLDAHHQDGGFLYDVSQQGPLLGLGIHF